MTEPISFNFQEGEVLLVDKPLTWTSFDVVNKIRYAIKKKLGIKKIKVGHAGTLDPLATGLLIICTGKFTKKIEGFQSQLKEYIGEFHVGHTTPSYDRETEFDASFNTDHINSEMIDLARTQFVGEIEQTPPIFSAIKVNGQAAYKKARKGQDIKLKKRTISIYDFEINTDPFPLLSFRVSCSKGTYIRSLAHEFGMALKSGAYLYSLRRTRIGDFSVENAWQLDKLIQHINTNP